MEEEQLEEQIVLQFLMKNRDTGLSITELVRISQLSRSIIRTILARLEGAGKIRLRKIGMAKVYSIKEDSLGKEHDSDRLKGEEKQLAQVAYN